MRKLTLLTAGAVGYVLGTRAGRERYEQIKSGAQKLKNNPTVQQKAREATTAVKENAPVVKDKVAEAASTAKSAAQDKLNRSDNGADSTHAGTTASAAPQPQG
jgi:hypothetical protein